MSKRFSLPDYGRPEDVRYHAARLTGRCPACDRRLWIHPRAVLAAKIVLCFFALIGMGGFVMGMAQVLGSVL